MKQDSLTKIISTKLGMKIDSVEFNCVYEFTLSYLTKGLTAFEYQKRIKSYIHKQDMSAKVFRLYLLKSKYTSFVLKLFILRLVELPVRDFNATCDLAAEFKIKISDVRRIHKVWTQNLKFRTRIREWYSQLPPETILSVVLLEQHFSSDIFPIIAKRIKSVTYRKLRFIARSSNLDLADLQNELSIKAIQIFYREFPSIKSVAHVINYIARAIENTAINIIHEATSLKKGRIVCTGVDSHSDRVFSLLMVSENQMPTLNATGLTPYSIQDQEANDTLVSLDNEICISTILSKYNIRSKKHRLLLILMGTVDEQFTLWLRSRKVLKSHEDNSDLQERLTPHQFRKLLSQFLHVSDDKVNIFLNHLGKRINGTYDNVTQKRAALPTKSFRSQ